MKILNFILFISFIISGRVEAASYEFMMNKCKNVMKENPPKISVVYNLGDIVYDFSKSSEEIEKLYLSVHKEKSSDANIFGLTEFSPMFEVYSKVDYVNIANGSLCFYPTKVNIRLGYKSPNVVNIANTIEKGSCNFRRVLRHEFAHLEIARRGLFLLARTVKKNINKIIEDTGPKISDLAPDKVAKELNDEYQDRILPHFAMFQSLMNEEQAKLDTKENYLKEQTICK